MHWSSVAAVWSLLNAAVLSWELTLYEDKECDVADQGRYRILAGHEQKCYTLDKDMPDVSCVEFTEGGAKHGGCFGGLTPASILIQTNELRDHCFLYNEENCGGTANDMGKGARACYDNEKMRAPWWNRNEAQIKSFKCWTQ